MHANAAMNEVLRECEWSRAGAMNEHANANEAAAATAAPKIYRKTNEQASRSRSKV